MTEKLTTIEISREARVTPKTVWRWITVGYKNKHKLYAERCGRHFLINRNTWQDFKLTCLREA